MTSKRSGAYLVAGLVLAATVGCATTSTGEQTEFSLLDPLGLGRAIFGLGKVPVRIGVTHTMQVDPKHAAPCAELQKAMARSLRQPVQFEVLQPFQIKAHLESGRLQFAMVDDEQAKEVLEDPAIARELARLVFESGANTKTDATGLKRIVIGEPSRLSRVAMAMYTVRAVVILKPFDAG